MIGNDSMDVSLENSWRSWFAFRKGKRETVELHEFQYHLEKHLFQLFKELNSGKYKHGGYRKFVVCDNKRREISVASIRDRIVHRLIYDHLTKIYDKTFIYDAWSCRIGKGLLGAIQRTQTFLHRFPEAYIWKGDVQKFFDSIDQKILLSILARKIQNPKSYALIREVVTSFSLDRNSGGGGAWYAYWKSDEPDFCEYLLE